MVIREVKKNFQTTSSNNIVGRITANEGLIMELLSKGFYSDVYGSIVREYTTNAWDATVAAGKDTPVVIDILYDDLSSKYKIGFRDKGIGMSKEFFDKTFMSYGESNKRNTDELHGMFGLGSKSFYAYSDNFFIETCDGETLLKGVMTKNEVGISTFSVISEEPSTDQGTYIWSFVESAYDVQLFCNAIYTQLLFFDNVFVNYDIANKRLENNYIPYSDIMKAFNEAKIIEYDTFCLTTFKYNNLLRGTHVLVFGKCIYEDVFAESRKYHLGNNIIGIKFPIDSGLIPTPNRESLQLSGKEVYETRMQEFYEEIGSLFPKEFTKISLLDVVTEEKSLNTCIITFKQGITINGYDLLKQFPDFSNNKKIITYNTRAKGFPDKYTFNRHDIIVNLCSIFLPIYRYVGVKETSHSVFYDRLFRQICLGEYTAYVKDEPKFSKKTDSYLRDISSRTNPIYLVKQKKLKLRDYKKILRLHLQKKQDWRQCIIDFQNELNEFAEEVFNKKYSEIKLPAEYLKKKQIVRSNYTLYSPKYAQRGDKIVTFDREQIFKDKDLESLILPNRTYLFFKTQEESLTNIYRSIPSRNFKFLLARSKKTYNELKEYMKTVNDLFSKDNKAFRKAITYLYIYNNMTQNMRSFLGDIVGYSLESDYSNVMGKDKVKFLKDFSKKSDQYISLFNNSNSRENGLSSTFAQQLIQLGKEQNLFVPALLEDFNNVKSLLDTYFFLKGLRTDYDYRNGLTFSPESYVLIYRYLIRAQKQIPTYYVYKKYKEYVSS